MEIRTILTALKVAENKYEIPKIDENWWKTVKQQYSGDIDDRDDWLEFTKGKKAAIARLTGKIKQVTTIESEETIWFEAADSTGTYMLALSVFLQCLKVAELEGKIAKAGPEFWIPLSPTYEEIVYMEK